VVFVEFFIGYSPPSSHLGPYTRSSTLVPCCLLVACCHVLGQAATALHLPAFVKVDPSNLVDVVRDVGKTLAFHFHVLFILLTLIINIIYLHCYLIYQYPLSIHDHDLYLFYVCAVPSPPVYLLVITMEK
jgi:hypothetical protein